MATGFTIGILRETQANPDKRTALTPKGAQTLLSINKALTILVQPSADRVFKDCEYAEVGCILSEDLSTCNLLLGVKEVEIDALIEDKTYMFFSHTAKRQAHNQPLLQAIIDKKITLIDYEYLYDYKKSRIAAFGYFAGLVGAYNTLRAYGLKYGDFELKSLAEITTKKQMWKELKKVRGGEHKIVITGNGKVSKGVKEVLQACGIFKVDLDGFFHKTFPDPVYYMASPTEYVKHKNDIDFTLNDFFTNPADYESNFLRFAQVSQILIAAHYWDVRSPRLFSLDDVKSDNFKIKLIGDISCDIDGSVPTTQKVSSIEDSFYDYNPYKNALAPPFSSGKNITVMAVDNLPSALPIESSEYFSDELIDHVLGYFWMGDYNKILKKATITKNGKLKKRFAYLRDFIKENE